MMLNLISKVIQYIFWGYINYKYSLQCISIHSCLAKFLELNGLKFVLQEPYHFIQKKKRKKKREKEGPSLAKFLRTKEC